MDRKFHVSLEVARLLKEKGYNNYSIVYDCSVNGSILLNQQPMYGEWAGDKDVYPCPTKAEAIDWLESKGIGISIIFCEIEMYEYVVESKDCYYTVVESGYKETRLEAEEAAIIGALKLL